MKARQGGLRGRRRLRACPTILHSLRDIPMRRLHAKSRLRQALANLIRDHHRTMMAAGAAERDSQIALAFADVMRHQVDQQLRDAVDELHGLRKIDTSYLNE